MLNREKFATVDIVCDGEDVAVVDGKPRRCTGTPCDIGKTVFLTREEAEAKLKEMEGANGE